MASKFKGLCKTEPQKIINMGRPHKKGLSNQPKKYKCSFCGSLYRMEWALRNHEKVCSWKFVINRPTLSGVLENKTEK